MQPPQRPRRGLAAAARKARYLLGESMKAETRSEIRLCLRLLDADPVLLATLEAPDEGEMLTALRNWNEAKVLEIKEWLPTMAGAEAQAAKERIRQYERLRELKRAA